MTRIWTGAVLTAVVLAAWAAEYPPGAGRDTPLYTMRRAPDGKAAWDLQFVPAPASPAAPCIEGQMAWDGTSLWTCVPGGQWVFQPALLGEDY